MRNGLDPWMDFNKGAQELKVCDQREDAQAN